MKKLNESVTIITGASSGIGAATLKLAKAWIKTAYHLNQQLRGIYNNHNDKHIAMSKLAHWYRNVEESGFKNFNILLNTITFNYQSILNYFDNRSTNASAESFNAKIKALDLNLEE